MRGAPLRDSFGRRIDYLRLSVTDRCNLRCVYCLPVSFSGFLPVSELLSADDLVELVSCFAEQGISKIRVTGGEPLVRPGIVDLIARLSRVWGLRELSLSTNGVLLREQARDLAKAGLSRVNISLDSLKSERFQRMTRFGRLEDVLAGIDAALTAGLSPVKINVVVAKGFNDDEIADFTRLTASIPVHVRFIELMPMGETGFFSEERWMPLSQIMDRAAPLEPLPPACWPSGHGPARYFRRPGAQGTVGFIAALSCGFCSSCNRMRLTAKGMLMPCLDASEGTDLRPLLRRGADRPEIQRLIAEAARKKPRRHSMLERSRGLPANSRFMCQIGG
ncbi:MAG: GTP 3',8-cyclase MoaA [Elusimicrobia bacterium]|nr:GTP 3',8-cyclase MoaA [Elusimicrobiota bacterium]